MLCLFFISYANLRGIINLDEACMFRDKINEYHKKTTIRDRTCKIINSSMHAEAVLEISIIN